jgi:glycosyltransferase involved in cell wall biosynthesis
VIALKILHVLRRWEGGVGTYVREVSAELELRGHEVGALSREDDLKICSLTRSFGALKRAVVKGDADVVNAHDWSMALPLLGLKNLVVTFHGYEAFPKLMLQRLAGWRRNLVVVSERLGSVFPEATVVEEGVNLKKFRPSKKRAASGVVGFVQQKSEFYLFGKIKDACDMLGVKFASPEGLPHHEMPEFYNSLSAFVSVPKRSGFNLCWLEAMACEVPTVGNYEGVGEKLPIIHVEGNEPGEIAAALKKALELQGKTHYRRWLNKNGYTWDRTAEKLLQVYRSV